MTRITKCASVATLVCGLFIAPLNASFGVNYSAREAGYFYAMLDIPTACQVEIIPWISSSSPSINFVFGDIWVYNSYTCSFLYPWTDIFGTTVFLTTETFGISGQIDWGPSASYTNVNAAQVMAVVYASLSGGGAYFKQEARSTLYPDYNWSYESGQSLAGTYWVEIEGLVGGDGQATAVVNIFW